MGQSNKRSNAFRDKVEEATGEIYDYTRKTDKGTKSLEIVPSKNMKENVVGDHSYDYNGKRESIIRVNAGDDYHFATKDDLVSNIVHEVNHNHNKLTKYFSDPYMLDVPIKEAKKFAKTKLDK
jgi:hypothetical protein